MAKKQTGIYYKLIIGIVLLIPLYIISVWTSFDQTNSITGYVVSEEKPQICDGYFWDKYCDDAPADCGTDYKPGTSLDACDECQTVKDGKVGYANCVGDVTTTIPSTIPPTSQICEDSDGGYNIYVKGFTTWTKPSENSFDKKSYDKCVIQSNIDKDYYYTDTFSCSGDKCFIWEETCYNGLSSAGQSYCPNGCKDGACILLGDITKDGCVNIFDLVMVTNGFGTYVGDANGDGIGNIFDIVLVQSNFGAGECKMQTNIVVNSTFINDTEFKNMSFINVTWINNTFINVTWINNTFINNSWSNNSFVSNVWKLPLAEITPYLYQVKFYFQDKGNYKLSIDMIEGIIDIIDRTKDDIITPEDVVTLYIGGNNKAIWYFEGYPYEIQIDIKNKVIIIMQNSLVNEIPSGTESYIMGDLNENGCIDVNDLVAVASSFNAKSGDSNYNKIADLNNDGVINSFDLNTVANNFGQGNCGTQPLPPIGSDSISSKKCKPQYTGSCLDKNTGKELCGNKGYGGNCYCDEMSVVSAGDFCCDMSEYCEKIWDNPKNSYNK